MALPRLSFCEVNASERNQWKELKGTILLAGSGSSVDVLSVSECAESVRILKTIPILQSSGSTVHGIEPLAQKDSPDQDKYLVYGERRLAVLNLATEQATTSAEVHDWILSAKCLLNNEIVLLYGRNSVSRFKYSIQENEFLLESKESVQSDENCVVMCGILSGSTWSDLFVLVGTVFGDIIVSRPSQGGIVLQRLPGHSGMIFYLAYDKLKERLYSVSDDRGLRVWQFSTDSLDAACCLAEAFGHSARPWCVSPVSNNRLITAGADSTVCLWSFDAASKSLNLLKRIVVDRGTIREMLGSETGALCCAALPKLWDQSVSFTPLTHKLKIRSFVAVRNGHLFATDSGELIFNEASLNLADRNLRHDCLALSSDGQSVLVATSGSVHILSADDPLLPMRTLKLQSVSVALWICCANDMILSASLDGSLTICQIESNDLHEKWKCKIEPGDRYLPTCAILLLHQVLIFGDRRGNITIIDASAMSKKVIKGAHEKQGVTDIRVVDTSSSPNGSTIRLQSIGRDGRLCTWQWFPTSTSLELMRSQVVGAPEKMEWPCKFLERHGRLLISGFRGPNFVLFDIDANHYLCSIECGGGHRFWQTEFADDRTIRFKFIKQGILVQADALLWSLTVTAPHLHVSQISSIAALNSESEFSLIVTGGIDTQLTVSVVNKGSRRIQVLQRITDHLSSVHCVTSKDGLVVSGGGRGEVKVWRLDDDRRLLPLLTCKEENQEARLLSVELFDLLGSVGLVAASSDGLLRCYQLNPDDRSASITAVVSLARQSPLGCVTKVAVLNDESGVNVIAIDTAGQVSAWSLTSWHCESPVIARSSTLVERSGLSALCAVALLDRRIAVVGSESGQLCALDCLRSSKIAAHMRHGATVTAIVAVERMAMTSNHTHILTTALDRRLSLTRLSITDESLELTPIRAVILTIADPAGLLVVDPAAESDGKIDVIAVGAGLEMIAI